MQEKARSFRKSMTPAEERIWFFLRNRRLNGYKFIREKPIGNYIADFVCREKKVIIEIDGSQHIKQVVYDNERTQYLQNCGYKVLRIWNNDVFKNIHSVLEGILNFLETQSH